MGEALFGIPTHRSADCKNLYSPGCTIPIGAIETSWMYTNHCPVRFIIEGLITFVAALAAPFLIDDFPEVSCFGTFEPVTPAEPLSRNLAS